MPITSLKKKKHKHDHGNEDLHLMAFRGENCERARPKHELNLPVSISAFAVRLLPRTHINTYFFYGVPLLLS